MPGPNVRNRAVEEKKIENTERKTYYLTDPKCQEIHGVEVTDKMREEGIILTSIEAMSLVASGAVTTSKDDAAKARDEQSASHDALLQRQQEEADARKVAEEEQAAAAAHNAGVTVDTAPVAKPGVDRPLSSAEVDQHMASDPAASPNPEGDKTWAQQGV